MSVFYFFIFLFGLCAGSFLNVIAFRYGSEKSSILARSQCMTCGKKLSWHELIPLLSFLLQKGKCKSCHFRFSIQYPLIEFITGVIFVLIFWKTDFFNLIFQGNVMPIILETVFLITIFSILIVISIYDYWHKIIPDGLVFAFIAISFFGVFLFNSSGSLVQDLLSGPIIASPFFFIWFISGGRWMGFGDVKLGLGIGYFLGILEGLYAVLWSFWIGGIFSIFLITFTSLFSDSKRFTMKSEVPFGPFMILGLAVAFFLEWNFLDFVVLLNL